MCLLSLINFVFIFSNYQSIIAPRQYIIFLMCYNYQYIFLQFVKLCYVSIALIILRLHAKCFLDNYIIITIPSAMGDNKIKGVVFRLKTWFVQLSFWKKIIIIFTLNTLILLILTDAIMLTLFGKISDDIINISNNQKEQFNQVSNTQIAGASAKKVLGMVQIYSNMLQQLANSYYYFTENPSIFTSLEGTNPQLPKLTSSFTADTFLQPGMYYLNSQSTFTALPYIDQLLSKMIRSKFEMDFIKRINVYVQDINNPNDLTVRTLPASPTFTVPSLQAVTSRFLLVNPQTLLLVDPYQDQYNTSSQQWLLCMRTIINTTGTKKIMMQIEFKKHFVQKTLENIYYFPSTILMIVGKTTQPGVYNFISDIPSQQLVSKLPIYFPIGTHRITYNGQDYVTASVGFNNIHVLRQSLSISNREQDIFRCIVLVKASETEAPSIQIQTFLQNQSKILKGIVFSWSFVILLSTVALATVVGNYIFSNLKMLSTKMQQYIKDPSKFHLIVIELKELQLKGILKKLSDNLIGIIQKIEVRKRERKDRINQNYHPLSVGEPKFQQRQQLNDYQIIQQIKEEVRVKVQALKKQAQQKEKAEKEKAEKEKAEKEKAEKEKIEKETLQKSKRQKLH